jgi:hypothetical protein
MNQKLASLTGIAFFGLLLASVLTSGSLNNNASGAKVLSNYAAHRHLYQVSSVLTVIAVFVAVIFFGVLRDYLRQHEASRGLTATAFGGVVLFAASGALSAGATWALADSTSHLTPATAQTLNMINQSAGNGLTMVGLAVWLFAFGLAIVQSGLLPRWLGWVAFPLALCGLIPQLLIVAFIGGGFWTLASSITMWLRLTESESSATAMARAT